MRPKMRPKILVARIYYLSKLFLFLIVLTFSHLQHDLIWRIKRKSHLKIAHPAVYRIFTLPSFPLKGLKLGLKCCVAIYWVRNGLRGVPYMIKITQKGHIWHFWAISRPGSSKIRPMRLKTAASEQTRDMEYFFGLTTAVGSLRTADSSFQIKSVSLTAVFR